jgi:hypothetical protein
LIEEILNLAKHLFVMQPARLWWELVEASPCHPELACLSASGGPDAGGFQHLFLTLSLTKERAALPLYHMAYGIHN